MREGLGCCWQRRKLVFCDLKAFEAAAVLRVVLVISWDESCDSACLTGLSAVPVVVTAHLRVGRFAERPGSQGWSRSSIAGPWFSTHPPLTPTAGTVAPHALKCWKLGSCPSSSFSLLWWDQDVASPWCAGWSLPQGEDAALSCRHRKKLFPAGLPAGALRFALA